MPRAPRRRGTSWRSDVASGVGAGALGTAAEELHVGHNPVAGAALEPVWKSMYHHQVRGFSRGGMERAAVGNRVDHRQRAALLVGMAVAEDKPRARR